jgi:hypothetical protein
LFRKNDLFLDAGRVNLIDDREDIALPGQFEHLKRLRAVSKKGVRL